MNKEEIFRDEMKAFNIEVDDIKPDEHIFGAIEKAIHKMKNEYLVQRLEVVLNQNLIEIKDKITDYRKILGCKVSYDDLPKDISFIVREDLKPSYDRLQQRIDKASEITEKIIEEYKIIYGDKESKLLYSLETQLEILKGE